MMHDNDKYIVFKRDDFNEWADADPYYRRIELPDSLADAIVIRPQDVFAGSGLSAYANAVQTFIEALDWSESPLDVGPLEDIRDFFFEQADIARQHPNKKVPD